MKLLKFKNRFFLFLSLALAIATPLTAMEVVAAQNISHKPLATANAILAGLPKQKITWRKVLPATIIGGSIVLCSIYLARLYKAMSNQNNQVGVPPSAPGNPVDSDQHQQPNQSSPQPPVSGQDNQQPQQPLVPPVAPQPVFVENEKTKELRKLCEEGKWLEVHTACRITINGIPRGIVPEFYTMPLNDKLDTIAHFIAGFIAQSKAENDVKRNQLTMCANAGKFNLHSLKNQAGESPIDLIKDKDLKAVFTTALAFQAIKENNYEQLRKWLEDGVPVNSIHDNDETGNKGNTLLHEVVACYAKTITPFLVKIDKLRTENESLRTEAEHATEARQREIAARQDVIAALILETTEALRKAASPYRKMVALLLKKGASVEIKNKRSQIQRTWLDETPLDYFGRLYSPINNAVAYERERELMTWLLLSHYLTVSNPDACWKAYEQHTIGGETTRHNMHFGGTPSGNFIEATRNLLLNRYLRAHSHCWTNTALYDSLNNYTTAVANANANEQEKMNAYFARWLINKLKDRNPTINYEDAIRNDGDQRIQALETNLANQIDGHFNGSNSTALRNSLLKDILLSSTTAQAAKDALKIKMATIRQQREQEVQQFVDNLQQNLTS